MRFASRITRFVGLFAGVALLLFILFEIQRQREVFEQIEISSYLVGLSVIGVLVWTIGNVLLGFSWYCLLSWSQVDCTLSSAVSLTMRTQVARYLPDSVFESPSSPISWPATSQPAKPPSSQFIFESSSCSEMCSHFPSPF